MDRSEPPITVPAPAPERWRTSRIRTQRQVYPGVTVTVKSVDGSLRYQIREPTLNERAQKAYEQITEDVETTTVRRPLTREGVIEQLRSKPMEQLSSRLSEIAELRPATRRCLRYRLCRDIECWGALTAVALDNTVETADIQGDRLVLHTEQFAPVETAISTDHSQIEQVTADRVIQYHVPFCGFDVPVVIYRQQLIGGDTFSVKYAVREPPITGGEKEAIETCKRRIWERTTDEVIEDPVDFVETCAREILQQFLTTEGHIGTRIRRLLPDRIISTPTTEDRDLDRLVYYVLRDYIGEGILSVPIRDPHLEDIEANRVGERIKVVPRSQLASDHRLPTNLVFEDEQEFLNVVTGIAAEGGVELTAANPSAKINIDPAGADIDQTIRCAVALPTISEGGPHLSIRKQAPEPLTPAELIRQNSISPELVALLWMLYEHNCVVLFSGPTGVGKTTLMNAHMPFIDFEDRPIAVDEGSREVRLPHETGVALSTREYGDKREDISMATLMTECNYLNPDVEVIAEINTPESFRSLAESLNTGHGVIGTLHADDVETLVNRMTEQGVAPYLLREIDLVVFPKYVDGQRYVTQAIEFPDSPVAGTDEYSGTIEKEGTTIYWNQVVNRIKSGEFWFAYHHPRLDRFEIPTDRVPEATTKQRLDRSAFDSPISDPDPSRTRSEPSCSMRVFHRIADRTDQPLQVIEAEFHRKYRYVQYLTQEGIDDFQELFEFLADLRTNEAATVERAARQASRDNR